MISRPLLALMAVTLTADPCGPPVDESDVASVMEVAIKGYTALPVPVAGLPIGSQFVYGQWQMGLPAEKLRTSRSLDSLTVIDSSESHRLLSAGIAKLLGVDVGAGQALQWARKVNLTLIGLEVVSVKDPRSLAIDDNTTFLLEGVKVSQIRLQQASSRVDSIRAHLDIPNLSVETTGRRSTDDSVSITLKGTDVYVAYKAATFHLADTDTIYNELWNARRQDIHSRYVIEVLPMVDDDPSMFGTDTLDLTVWPQPHRADDDWCPAKLVVTNVVG